MRLIDVSEWDSYMSDMLDSRNVLDAYDKGYMDAMDNVDDWLDAQTTLTLDDLRPHGRWVISCDGYYPYCSNCKQEPKSGDMTPFCPDCGAKMDLEAAHGQN